ncbi:HAMP domain-containing protein [Alicyclobacillus suci]|uniref:HAMP domain-containing protein n=1 Tax=Alicyclobacillus suci TaxID=2816080 RepID=UPI001A8D1316|nr:cache domain-containing protein [Alicyclobacillus suci]
MASQPSFSIGKKTAEHPRRGHWEGDIIEGQKYLTNYDPIRNTNGQVIGMWFVGTPVASINHIVTSVLTVILIALGIVTFLSIVAVLWFTNGLKKRLQGIGRALGEAGTGNFTVTLADNSNDEIGQLTQSYHQMKSSLQHWNAPGCMVNRPFAPPLWNEDGHDRCIHRNNQFRSARIYLV